MFKHNVLVEARNVVITLSIFLRIEAMKKSKLVAPKLTAEVVKVLYLARYNFGGVVGEGQQ